ncbi:MAG TPA: lipopolysaccharide kinase InaA family protein, partial [Candidatus Polarisedimenticolia bacterium]|nr:lipopolysaccharide kinase InaA family protein [Candidatus Polarisedimenticolia bacterium]
PRGASLQALLGEQPLARRRRRLARGAGRSVRAMHDAGFVHADLNLGNLVAEDGGERMSPAGASEVHVIDLDGGRFGKTVGFGARRRNLRRLLRSYEKWIAPASPLDRRDAFAFLRAYCGTDQAMFRRLLGDLGGASARFRLHRLAWRRGRAMAAP